MEAILEQLNQTPGVTGSAVFSGAECLSHKLDPPYEPIILQQFLEHLEQVSDTCASIDESGKGLDGLVIQFEAGSLIVKQRPDCTLVVLAGAEANIAMLAVALSAAVLKIDRAGGAAAISTSGVQTGISISQSFQAPPAQAASEAPVRTTQDWDDAPVPKDAVGAAVFRHILKTYSRYMGPRAKAVLGEELDKLGASPRTLRTGQVADLIKRAAARIPYPDQRDEFVNSALGQ